MDYVVHGAAKSCTRLSDFRFHFSRFQWGFPGGASGKERTCLPMQELEEMQVQSLGWEDP